MKVALFSPPIHKNTTTEKKMRIAYLVWAFPVLSETFILNEIIELIRNEHDVQVFSFSIPSVDIVQDEFYEYKLLERTHYFRIWYVLKVNPLKYFTFLLKLLIKSFSTQRPSFASLYKNFQLAYFATIIEEKRVELIHAHLGGIGNYSIRLKNLLKKPLITSFYGVDASAVLFTNPILYNKLFKEGDLFIALSNHIKRRLIAHECPENKIIVYNIGVDVKNIKYHKREPIKYGEKIKILIVGRFVEKKGIPEAICAFEKTLKKHNNLELRLIGEGPLMQNIINLIKKLDISQKVFLLGSQPHSKVIEEMYNSHIFMLPSITAKNGDQEGLGFVFVEAQATGMPVLSTYHDGIPEIVINNETGFLVDEGDIDALSEKLFYLIEHQELWTEFGKNGRKLVEKRYNTNKQIKKLEKIYEDLI